MNFLKEFFEFNRSNEKKRAVSGECKICNKVYSDNIGSTGDPNEHLKRKHSNQYEKSKFPDLIS